MISARAAILVHDGFTDAEFIFPYYRFQEEGDIETTVITLMGKDAVGDKGWIAKGDGVLPFSALSYPLWDILILVGGIKSIERMRQNDSVLKLIRQHRDGGKVIGSICHGASLLISARVVSGKRISGYYSIADDISNAGAIYTDEPVVTDGNLVTTAHYKHLGPWMREILRVWRETSKTTS